MDEVWVDPIGAGRAALATARESTNMQPLFPSSLMSVAADLDLDESDLALGIELARFAAGELREPILYLVTALRAAERQGSTRLCLEGDALFDALDFPLVARQFAASVPGRLAELAPLFAGAGAFADEDAVVDAPLITEGGYLYSGAVLC